MNEKTLARAAEFGVTPESVEDLVQMTQYFHVPGTTVTIATLHLASGFVVTGESSTANPNTWDAERGKEIARQKAIAKLTELQAFRVAQMRYEATNIFAAHFPG